MKKSFQFLSLLLILSSYLIAQKTPVKDCSTIDHVAMQPSQFDLRTKNNAIKNKIKILGGHQSNNDGDGIQPPNLLDFDINAFFKGIQDMLNIKGMTGLKIYFGAFQKAGTADDEYTTKNINKLIPIFVPTTNVGDKISDLPYSYILDHKNGVFHKIQTETKGAWIKQYNDSLYSDLCINTDKSKIQETNSLWYNRNDLSIWNDFITCHLDDTDNKMKVVQMYFGAFDPSEGKIPFSILDASGSITIANTYDVSNQLTILFKIPGAPVAPKQMLKQQVLKMKGAKKRYADGFYDTGVPCPPYNCN